MSNTRMAAYALGVIFIANLLNYTDRQLVSALEKPLSSSFNLGPTQFGLLWTLFTVGYMVCAMPIGLMADRLSRTKIFAICIWIWSLATVASGLAQERWVLYVARVFIGVGEAGCLVIGPSVISDLFSKQRRGKALSIFYLGMPIGGTAAFIMAGAFYEYLSWREMFLAAGLPGFPVGLMVWLLPDPPRGATEGIEEGHGHGGGNFKEYLGLLQNKTLMLIIMAQAFAVFILIPLIHFGTGFFTEQRGLGETEARVALGLMALTAGVLGNSLSGVVGDWLARRMQGAYAFLAGVGFMCGLPCLVLGFTAPSRWVFIPALTLGCFFYFLCMPAVNTQIANVAGPRRRATAWALAVFVLHLLGDMVSPPLFGEVEKQLVARQSARQRQETPARQARRERAARERAFLWFSMAMIPASLCCFAAAHTAAGDMARVEKEVEEANRAPGDEPPDPNNGFRPENHFPSG